jgi:hypothetical protein
LRYNGFINEGGRIMNVGAEDKLRKISKPFLAHYAENKEEMVIEGRYDEEIDIHTTDGRPSVNSNGIALDTITFTKAFGEANDRD